MKVLLKISYITKLGLDIYIIAQSGKSLFKNIKKVKNAKKLKKTIKVSKEAGKIGTVIPDNSRQP